MKEEAPACSGEGSEEAVPPVNSESTRWAKVPVSITDAGLTHKELLAYIRLSGYASGETRLAFPSAETIGEDLRVSRRRARDLLAALQVKDIIRKVGPERWSDCLARCSLPDGYRWRD